MKYLLTTLLLVFTTISYSQKSTLPAWHVVEPKAEYKFLNDVEGELTAGEAVLVYKIEDGKHFAFDVLGRMILFNKSSSLIRCQIANVNELGLIKETIQIAGGDDINESTIVWIVAQDVAKGTYKIQTTGGRTIDVPSSKVDLYYKTYYRDQVKERTGFKRVD